MSTSDQSGSFTRWQSITVAQLTCANNLILGLGVAAVGFQITLLLNEEFDLADHWQVIAFLFLLLSLLLLSVSVTMGIWLVVNLLREFRARMRVALARGKGVDDQDVDRQQALANRLRVRSWRLFWWQSAAFGIGFLFAVMGAALLAFVSGEMSDTGCNI